MSCQSGTCCGGKNIAAPSCSSSNKCGKCTFNRDFFHTEQVFGGGIPTSCNACKFSPNTVKDYTLLEGTTDFGTISLRRNIDTRRVRLDNSTPYTLAIAIETYRYTPECSPQPIFILEGGSSRTLGVNPSGDNLQFIYVYDYEGGKLINTPHPIHFHNNTFVIRSGNYERNYGEANYQSCDNSGKEIYRWVWINDYYSPLK